jgi:hypothetical protein
MSTSRSTNASATAAPKALTLNFDPRYVEFLIHTWLARDLAPIDLDALIAATTRQAQESFTALNTMGLREEVASADEVKRAIALLKSLGLLKQKKVTPKPPKQPKRDNRPEARSMPVVVAPPYTDVTVTSEARNLLTQPQATGGLRPGIVRRIVVYSPQLTALLQALHEYGPIVRPARGLTPFAPTRGAAYTRAVEDGLAEFWTQVGGAASLSNVAPPAAAARRPTAAKLVDNATAEALRRHPAGALKLLDKLIAMASELGLVWNDATQVNDVIAAHSTGSAAIAVDKAFVPNVPTWDDLKSRFIDALTHAHAARADGTGFVTVEALRGALGQALQLSAPIVDAMLCQARTDGDQRRSAVTLHFEPDEDATYALNRRPLIWHGRAYDQVLVTYPSNMKVANAMAHQASN